MQEPEKRLTTLPHIMIDLKNNQVLIVGPSWIGDMVMAHSLFKLLCNIDKHVEITVLAPAWSRALLERMPEVKRSIELPFAHGELKIRQRRKFARQLKGQFDTVIILPNSFKSALIPFFAGISERIGWQGEFRNLLLTDCRKLEPTSYPLMVQRFIALGLEAGVELDFEIPKPKLVSNRRDAIRTVESLGLNYTKRVLIICPGAEFGESKQWPESHYARLCKLAIQDNWQVWIIGSDKDRLVARKIRRQLEVKIKDSCSDITGQTSLGQAIDLMSLASMVVSNDSGLMHIAAAVGSPVVALYGSTSPDFTPPLAERVKSVTTEISCRPCFQRSCPLGHKRCLTEISADRVYIELNQLLDLADTGVSSSCEY